MPVAPNRLNTLYDNRVEAIRKAHIDAGLARAELDLSGGIDSAVMAGLLVMALGPANVTLAHTNINSNPEQTARAQALAEGLGCRLAIGDFTPAYEMIVAEIRRSLVAAGYDDAEIEARLASNKTILGSIRSTLRAPLGRGYNRVTGGGIRHGTGNECEDRFLRFYQKGGDGEVDSNPIAMLSKGEVYQLAYWLAQRTPSAASAYRAIIEATPSPDLWGEGDGHSDEAELQSWTGAPFTYSRIDPDTGEYTYVGSIERVSRFLDLYVEDDSTTMGDLLFADNLSVGTLDSLTAKAGDSGLFEGLDKDTVISLLWASHRIERITRHKENPNCPTYGTRKDLVRAGILLNTLPVIAG